MLTSLFKSIAIKATDLVNKLYDPFDEFTRPQTSKTSDTLKKKAEAFETDLIQNFRLAGGIWNYRRVADGSIDMGDQALWHGIFTAMWAFKYAVTAAPGDQLLLMESLDAMFLHQRGTPPRLIRGVNPGIPAAMPYADDASNDTLTGHFTGIYFAWKYGDANARALAVKLGTNIVEDLTRDGDYSIHRQDGTPTSFGRLVDGIKTDPLRLSLCLAILKWAVLAVSPKYQRDYEKLWRRYGVMVSYAKVKLLWWEQKYDSHRAALHLTMLADMEIANVGWQATYCSGLRRVWQIERKSGNAWIAFLVERHAQIPYEDMKNALKWLREFEIEERGPVVERINSTFADHWKEKGVRFFQWGGKLRSSQPLPVWTIGSQDFFPQRNLFSVDNWTGETTPNSWHSGADFLAIYWLGRLIKVIGDAD